ncbi:MULTISPECIES: L-aspartate oxidase [Bacillaceae]|uniref:L-aspartate oxidase n=1 Tax=Evansella alkalicola TaxID=745819 RepID=A0ABS6JUE5_9BACI|nr:MULTISPECIES: L-aspartate oxidase [Bacillaceae]MBU9720765.1 L-aspartate oxidase [Bacillus alkalicola]
MREVIIVGAGMSALVAAIILSKENNVKVFTKGKKTDGNSWRAQGGIAAAIHKADSPSLHLTDTLTAGCFHNDSQMVSTLVTEGPKRVMQWILHGMTFDQKSNGELALGMEGAHSKRRILHAGGDRTGTQWMSFLNSQLRHQPNIHVFENESVIDLVIDNGICKGVYTKRKDGGTTKYSAHVTVLATGGCGGLFEATTNDPSIIGDGIAMAYRAGALLSDLEFIQFHPTLIKHKEKVLGLASEALRGEGARLIDSNGNEIMDGVHPSKDLAPRDVVARVIERRTMEGNQIYLDISSIANFETRFPAIFDMCVNGGISISEGRIPVTIGAHFLMGGIVTDAFGKTTVPGLFAIGEVARTGVHGANRLASNSLLEALVFGERTAEKIQRELEKTANWKSMNPLKLNQNGIGKPEPVLPERSEIQQRVSQALGVERNEHSMKRLLKWLMDYDVEKLESNKRISWTHETIERSNMLITAWLITKSALERKESRGAHYRTDYPASKNAYACGKQIFIQRSKENKRESMKL